jgi:UDP:flavonoid glycosyltransferase YjiC (YdhE family)
MSTTPQDQSECLQRAIDALSALPVRGIVTTGPAVDPKALRPSGNVTVVASAPHSDLLKCASAVVTHGGHGTVIRSLAAGVPLVVMPQGRDQADNAARLESRGAGITIKSSASAATIGTAVKRVLEHRSYHEAAKRLGDAIRADAAADTLVNELER